MMNDFCAVSERAVIQRINRKLFPDHRRIKTSRSARAQQDLGRYYMVDFKRNFIVDKHIDLEDLAIELKCLAAWEKVVAE
jgi:hypothetical protein